MKTSIYSRHRFHPDIIRRPIWMYFRFNLSFRDVVVQHRRNTKAATRLLRKLLRNQGVKPTRIVTDRLGSYGAALKLLGLKHLQNVGGRKNNRAECSHVPIRRRERKSQKFRSVKNAQKLLSAHGQIYNLFNYRRHLISRNTLRKFRYQAQIEWNIVTDVEFA